MIGVDKITTGVAQNAVNDSVMGTYANGNTRSESIGENTWPILDSVDNPTGGKSILGGSATPSFIGAHQNNIGQDRTIDMNDNPQATFPLMEGDSPLVKISGVNDFHSFAVAVSSHYDLLYGAYAEYDWRVDFGFEKVGANWVPDTASVSNLEPQPIIFQNPTSLDDAGIGTSKGPTFISVVHTVPDP